MSISQPALLLAHLSNHGSITQMEAFIALGVTRLSERVRDLERLGYVIRHDWVTVPSRTGHARVVRYSLIKEPASMAAA